MKMIDYEKELDEWRQNQTLSEILFYKAGSDSWTSDFLFLLTVPFGVTGFLLNMFSLALFIKIDVNTTQMYKYLRVYAINSAILCTFNVTTFYTYTPRYFAFEYSFLSRVNLCIITNFVKTLFVFYSFVLDILISLERLAVFIDRLKVMKNVSAYIICFISFILCSIVNSPVYFWYYVKSNQEFYSELFNLTIQPDKFYFCGRTGFLNKPICLISSALAIFIRDILTLLVEVVTGLLLAYYCHQFVKRRTSLGNFSENDSRNFYKVLKMTLILSLLSIITHVCLFVFFLIGMFNFVKGDKIWLREFYWTTLTCLFKYSSNFFVFYFFNTNSEMAVRAFYSKIKLLFRRF
jgi:hypothetical protein